MYAATKQNNDTTAITPNKQLLTNFHYNWCIVYVAGKSTSWRNESSMNIVAVPNSSYTNLGHDARSLIYT